MNKKILLILAEGFEEVEALGSVDFLRRCGFDVCIAGLTQVKVASSRKVIVVADTTLAATNPADFDVLLLPGGSMTLYESDAALLAVKSAYQANKLIAAICAAPAVLCRAGLLMNRTFTCYPGMEPYLNGAKPTGKMVEVDGRIITGRGPAATFLFAAKIASELGFEAKAKEVMSAMLW